MAGEAAFEPLLREQCAALEEDLHQEGGGVRVLKRAPPQAAGEPVSALLDAGCEAVGLRGIGDRWNPADRRLLEMMLRIDQLFSGDLRTRQEAAALAGRFLALLEGGEPELWCNFHDYGDGTHAFTPVSPATFNLCLAAVTPSRVAIIWLDQED